MRAPEARGYVNVIRRVFVASVAVAAGCATAAPVNIVGVGTQAFDVIQDLDQGSNVVLDSVVNFTGLSLGERFQGQTRSSNGDFDSISGTPSNPLTLISGGVNQNLYSLQGGIAGLSHNGVAANGIGEGAVAMRFGASQSGLRFGVIGSDGGTMDVSFFRSDGSLISHLLGVSLPIGSGNFEFQRDGGVSDIAGLVIQNANGGGIAYDNVGFDLVTIPLPTGAAMAGLGLGLVGVRRRR